MAKKLSKKAGARKAPVRKLVNKPRVKAKPRRVRVPEVRPVNTQALLEDNRQLRFGFNVMKDALETISVKADRMEWVQPKTFKQFADGALERVNGRR